MNEFVLDRPNTIDYKVVAKWLAVGLAGVIAANSVMGACDNKKGGGGSGGSSKGSSNPGGGHRKTSGGKYGPYWQADLPATGLVGGAVAIEAIPDAADIRGLPSEQPFIATVPLGSLVAKPGFQE